MPRKPKTSKKSHNPDLARGTEAAMSQNKGLCTEAKSKPAKAGLGKKHGPVGRSTAAQKKDSKPKKG